MDRQELIKIEFRKAGDRIFFYNGIILFEDADFIIFND